MQVTSFLHKLFGTTPGKGVQPKEAVAYGVAGFGQNFICTIIGSYLTVFMTDAEVRRAVYFCRQIQFVRDLHEILAKKVDIEYANEEGHRQGKEGVHCARATKLLRPTKVSNRLIVGDGEKFTRYHHRCKQEGKECVFAFKFQSCQSESGKYGDYEGHQGRCHTNNQGVNEISSQIRFCEYFREVSEVTSARGEQD